MVMGKLMRWIIFSVFFASLPFVGNYLIEISKGHAVTFGNLFGKGELLLAGITLCGVGLGELVGVASSPIATPQIPTHIFAGGSLTIVFLASLYYATVSTGTDFNPDTVAFVSLWMFSSSVLMSSGCIAIAALAEVKTTVKLTETEKVMENKEPEV